MNTVSSQFRNASSVSSQVAQFKPSLNNDSSSVSKFNSISFSSPTTLKQSFIKVAEQHTKAIREVATQKGAYGNEGNQDSYNKKTSIFIAITGGFKGDGSDVTSRVVGNSPTEKIYMATQQQAHNVKTQLNGLFIAPSESCESTVNTVTNFVSKNRSFDEKVVIYGYSNGGRCAIDAATALQQKNQSVDLLLTVDATDRKNRLLGTNSTVDNSIPSNVKVHQNFYQQDECGWITCPQGEPHSAESPKSTLIVNHQTKASDISNPEYKSHIHRHMEDINKQDILSILSNALNIEKKQ